MADRPEQADLELRVFADRPRGFLRYAGQHCGVPGPDRHADLRRLRGLRHGPERDPSARGDPGVTDPLPLTVVCRGERDAHMAQD